MKRLKKIEGDQLPIDELLPDATKSDHKPAKKALKKRPLYRVRKSNPQENRTNTSSQRVNATRHEVFALD